MVVAMEKTAQIDNQASISKTFWRFALPSIVATLASGLYQVVDGFFVGQYVGADGLAGINMSFPLLVLVIGTGLMIGMGGGSLISVRRGEQDSEAAKATLAMALLLILLLGSLAVGFLFLMREPVLSIQHAQGVPASMARQYLEVMTCGAFLTIGAVGLPVLVRNDDRPHWATGLIVMGAVLNIILDYVFMAIFDLGLRGAAFATLIAQSSICVFSVVYFFSSYSKTRPTVFRFDLKIAKRIMVLGSSSLMMFIYFGFIMGLHNKLLMAYGSATHVAAFAIVFYIACLYYFFSEGMANGLQPPVSYSLGAKQPHRIVGTLKLALTITIGLGVLVVGLLYAFPEHAVAIFARNDPLLAEVTSVAIRIHLSALFLDGFLFVATIYFLAVGEAGKSLLISVGNMLVQIPFLLVLPQYFGVNGVWLAVPLSNVVLTCVVAPMLWLNVRGLLKQTLP